MKSMTGYGKASHADDEYEVSVELRGVNNRYLELAIRMPKEYGNFENDVRKWLKSELFRGKINVFVTLTHHKNPNEKQVISISDANNLFAELSQMREALQIAHPITMQDVLNYYSMSDTNGIDIDDERFVVLLKSAVSEGLAQFNQMREEEGRNLQKDVESRIKTINDLTELVKQKAKLNVGQMFDKMVQNVQDLIDGQKIDASRLEQEIAIISDKVDITEECVRMDSHLDLFGQTMRKKGEKGKKLTFILQEMLREANTMNSKNSDVEIQHQVIRIKEEIEKIREQAQNIE